MDGEAKHWWQSRTVWFNVVSFAVAALGILVSETAVGADGEPLLSSHVVAVVSGVVIPLGNLILRSLTTQPIGR